MEIKQLIKKLNTIANKDKEIYGIWEWDSDFRPYVGNIEDVVEILNKDTGDIQYGIIIKEC